MIIKYGIENLKKNIVNQLSCFWLEVNQFNVVDYVEIALSRLDNQLSGLNVKGIRNWEKSEEVTFSPRNTVQYACFLYILSNELYKADLIDEADSVYYLNKIMNCVEWYYAIELPKVWYAEHPIGSVLGKATYGERFFLYQGCTVGGNRDSKGRLAYPSIGENVIMYSNSSIIGNCRIGNNVIIASHSYIINQDVPDNCIVFGNSPNIVIKEKDAEQIKIRTSHIWK